MPGPQICGPRLQPPSIPRPEDPGPPSSLTSDPKERRLLSTLDLGLPDRTDPGVSSGSRTPTSPSHALPEWVRVTTLVDRRPRPLPLLVVVVVESAVEGGEEYPCVDGAGGERWTSLWGVWFPSNDTPPYLGEPPDDLPHQCLRNPCNNRSSSVETSRDETNLRPL